MPTKETQIANARQAIENLKGAIELLEEEKVSADDIAPYKKSLAHYEAKLAMLLKSRR
jgi:hypothetical protein